MTREEIERVIYLSYQYTEIVRNEGPLRQSKIDFILEGLKEQQQLLPANIDEAAEEYEMSIGSQDYCYLDIEDAFKAGVEWMVGQGYAFETTMQEDDLNELVPTCPDMHNHGYSCGDKVIIQIRKKEE